VTISRNIKFCTAELLPNQSNKTFVAAVRHVTSALRQARIQDHDAAHGRGSLRPIRDKLRTLRT
jgi:hypothetical protein